MGIFDVNTSRYLQDQREALRASVEYFRSGNAIERNLWVGREFLQNLNLSFVEGEVMAPPSDPPDLIFRDFHAEVKEILDPGRKRHAEYKEALLKAERARDPQELLKDFSPKHLLPSELVNLVESRMPSMSDKYVRAFRATTDLFDLRESFGALAVSWSVAELRAALGVFVAFGFRGIWMGKLRLCCQVHCSAVPYR
ncbi:MAG: DUF1780 domain-containing protein [Betaproteobacteria bacterium]|nr:DUF1780 domain-containing protein [Betaproteobacteria bacterium]